MTANGEWAVTVFRGGICCYVFNHIYIYLHRIIGKGTKISTHVNILCQYYILDKAVYISAMYGLL